ncbi:PEP/pyruvate-binding domain-containing protein [Guyparkeria sp.]|uniref:PEP/pyruvate-binding domain-containing protein n=1 Tax=Guyparkeria sp. TaxID=2035736 RepID=UPI003565D761
MSWLLSQGRGTRRFLAAVTIGLLLTVHGVHADSIAPSPPDPAQMRAWVDDMKDAPRGPFKRIRWFCEDGTILPPEPYACRPHGGGVQHGEWSDRTVAIREQGFLIATLLADLDATDHVGDDPHLDELRQVLLERFLIRFDDGWIFRKARYYRGAIQIEDEQRKAREILLAMVNDPDWLRSERYLLLREAVRLLPVNGDEPAATRVRELSTRIAEEDPGFQDLRVKIHGMPDAGDAQRVRRYARDRGEVELADSYRQLADELDVLYEPQTAIRRLERLADESRGRPLEPILREAAERLDRARDLDTRLELTAEYATAWRERVLDEDQDRLHPADRLRLLQAGLALEQEAYAVASRLAEASKEADRRRQLVWLADLAAVLHGSGFLSARQQEQVTRRIDGLVNADEPRTDTWTAELRYLSRVSQWAQRSMGYHFDPTVERWSIITNLATHYIPDRLRDSPLLPYTRVLDTLLEDANARLGIRHELFGEETAAGLRALNPGLRRGVLLEAPDDPGDFREDGIYLMASTTPDLPPVAGILTRGEGSSLSHVQLLARNLGIPNVVVDDALMPRLDTHLGERVVLAVTPRGRVQLAADGPEWDKVFGAEPRGEDVVIRPDLDKLDLDTTEMLPLAGLRASDSGRRVGPKAANLGELAHFYPERVSPGMVVPFGVFRELLDRPIEAGGPAVFDWMRGEYDRLATIEDSERRREETREMLGRLREWITTTSPGQAFRAQLRSALEERFGSSHTPGVFVRSDTNVEDLPGFTGAGLNRTVANVVGFESIVDAIRTVWASPFTERAHAWRQAHMPDPEHVYPAVLLQQTVPAEKSGVLVTTDMETGDRDWLTIAANEGVGGVVDGQSAEELRVHRRSGKIHLLAQATAPTRTEPAPDGGMRRVPASAPEELLTPSEIDQLRRLANDVEARFPLVADNGTPPPVDIEFGFVDGRLALFQIRPLVENRQARRNLHLAELDREGKSRADGVINPDRPPRPAE